MDILKWFENMRDIEIVWNNSINVLNEYIENEDGNGKECLEVEKSKEMEEKKKRE